MSVSAVGHGEDEARAWLIVGGEVLDDLAPAAVELVFPLLPDGARRRYTVLLPEGVGPRRGHAAASRAIFGAGDPQGAALERDVVVVGGFAPGGGMFDEVLIFSLDPFDPPGAAGPPPLDPNE